MSDWLSFLSSQSTLIGLGTVAAATAYYVASRPTPFQSLVDLDNQSIELPGPERARISRFCPGGKLVATLYDDVKTQYDVFCRGRRISGDSPCLGWRPDAQSDFKWMTYNEANERATNLGSGLVSKFNCTTDSKTFIGIYAQNKPEWVITEMAVLSYRMILVPLYDTLGPDASGYIINQAEISTVVCDAAKVPLLFDVTKRCPQLKVIVKIGDVTEEEKTRASELDLHIISMTDLEAEGAANHHDHVPPLPSDLSTICYTSGTTGDPKGVMLTHANFIANTAGAFMQLQADNELNKDDVHLSYLPLAHAFERIIQCGLFCGGARVGFFQGDIKLLMNDLQTLKPTVFPSVPRLLNRVYDKVMASSSKSFVKKTLFQMAIRSKENDIKRGIIRNDSIWDKIVFKKVQATLGGRIRLVLSGSAPLSSKVMSFLRCALGCHVLEGYGQTESTAGSTLTLLGSSDVGQVGPPLPCNKIKLVDVPELDYFAENGQGEVCFWGPNVFKGYYKNPEKTKEALDEDGWLHSGDIGEWHSNGSLRIIDRKKHIFKLAQGEYVAPEKIEQAYNLSSLVAQTFIYGESLQAYIVAVIVPDEEVFAGFSAEKGWKGTFAEICASEEAKKAVLDDIVLLGKKNGLKGFEQAKAVYLHPRPFSIEDNLITPSMKVKRPAMKQYFKAEIAAMYAAVGNA